MSQALLSVYCHLLLESLLHGLVVERGFHQIKICFTISVHVWKKLQFYSFILENTDEYCLFISLYDIRFYLFIHSLPSSVFTIKSGHLSDFGAENTIVVGKNHFHDCEGNLRGNPHVCLDTNQHVIVSLLGRNGTFSCNYSQPFIEWVYFAQ